MDKNENEIKENYQKYLDPTEFKEFKLKGFKEENDENNYDFYFKCLYDYFCTAGFNSSCRLLELGSGPTVHNIASACGFIPYVVQSEFVEANCEELRRWLKKEPGHLDWTPFIRRIARAEGKSDLDAACPEIESRIRHAVKAVIHGDVLDENIISPDFRKEPYDVVLSCLTLETAAVSKESYSAILGRIRKLLKPKGKLVLIGIVNCSYWEVGNNKFHCLPLELQDIRKALEENNYSEIQWRLRDKPDEELPFDCTQLYFLTCTKFDK